MIINHINKTLFVITGTSLSGIFVWAIYNLPAIFLLVYPVVIAIWITIFSLKKVEHVVEVTHLIGLVFVVYMPMLLLEILLVFSLFFDFTSTLKPILILLVVWGWYAWIEDYLKIKTN